MVSSTQAFVTGGTGLIGRAVVARLLARGIDVTLLLRPGAERRRSETLETLRAEALRLGRSLRTVEGDLGAPELGLSSTSRAVLGRAAHCFHLAALYDIAGDERELLETNVEGTRRLLQALGAAGFSGRLHHASSIAVAGDFEGSFSEAMFDEGQEFPHPYHRSKYEAEKLVRESSFDYRIYRPSSVVGDSVSGAIDKIDGIYFAFPAIQKLAHAVPRWVRLPFPRIRGAFNLVPVDYVADATVHIALAESQARVFHLVDPEPPSLSRMSSILVAAAGGPRLGPALSLDRLSAVSKATKMVSSLPSFVELRDALLRDLGLPAGALGAMNPRVRFEDTNCRTTLSGSGIHCPPLESYAKTLYRYYEDHLDPAARRDALRHERLDGKVVLVTGSSRGVGRALAVQAAQAGAVVLLVARSADKLESAVTQIREAGGLAHAYPTDLSSYEEVDALAETVLREHGGVDVLVHNAAHSIRRPASLSVERFHDYERLMALNYFAPVRLTLRLLASLREREGAISHVLTQGVLIPTPFFPAYTAT